MTMKKSLLPAFLRKSAPKPTMPEIHQRLMESFAKFADNPAVRWESQQQRELAMIGGILSHGDPSVPVALAMLPTLKNLAHLTPEEAMQQGEREWQDAMDRLSHEVQKLGAGPQENTFFRLKLKGTQHDAHRN